MGKAFRRVSVSSLAYISLLMAFTSLGVFVAALATGSLWTTIAGVVLIACLAASVAGFRAAARTIARCTAVAEPASAVSIFSTPLQQDQIDRYLKNYRTEKGAIAQVGCVLTVGAGAEKRRRCAPPAVGRNQRPARSDRTNRLDRRLNRARVTA
jgi:cell division protein FtsW (lipid II flippase)